MEIWRDISGFEGHYQVNNIGGVRSIKQGRIKILQPVKSHSGYLKVHLSLKSVVLQQSVHRLVAEAFIPNPANLSDVNHLDRVKHNNKEVNLEWISKSHNNLHAYAGEHGRKRKVAQIDPTTNKVVRTVDCISDLKDFGIATPHVTTVCRGRRKTCNGFIFKYLD